MTKEIIKFKRIALDKKTAFLCPLDSSHYLVCGDKNGRYTIAEKQIEGMTIERAWDSLFELIHD